MGSDGGLPAERALGGVRVVLRPCSRGRPGAGPEGEAARAGDGRRGPLSPRASQGCGSRDQPPGPSSPSQPGIPEDGVRLELGLEEEIGPEDVTGMSPRWGKVTRAVDGGPGTGAR